VRYHYDQKQKSDIELLREDENMDDSFAAQPKPDYIDQLAPMDLFLDDYPIAIDIVYKNAEHPNNNFGKVYRDGVRLWLHKDLAAITLLAATIANKEFEWTMTLYDGLRTTTSQATMFDTDTVKSKSKEWQKTFISAPGGGSHPRGLAIDTLPTKDNELVRMGSEFDDLANDEKNNPAARYYFNFGKNRDEIFSNRYKLQVAFQAATDALGHSLWQNTLGLYPDEIWHHDLYIARRDEFPVISDAHLPRSMRMTDRYLDHPDPDGSPGPDDWQRLAGQIHDQVQSAASDLGL
jgi:D-alanyl-D-alanine dipeptidase